MKIKLSTVLLGLGCLLLPACASQKVAVKSGPPVNDAGDDVYTVAVGSVNILDFDSEVAPNPLVGNKTIAEVQPGVSPRQLRVIPVKKGSTAVIVYDTKGKMLRKLIFNVVTNDLSQRTITIRALLKKVEGITVEALDDRIVIDGKLKDEEDRERVLQVQAAYYDWVLNLAVPVADLCATRRCVRDNGVADHRVDAQVDQILDYWNRRPASHKEGPGTE